MLMSLKLLALLLRVCGYAFALLMMMLADEVEGICADVWHAQLAAGRSSWSRFRSALAFRLSQFRSGALGVRAPA
jgi:hypothetical protein